MSLKHLQETMEYIHQNPVKKEIVLEPGKYNYSSYRYYFDGDKSLELLTMEI